MSAQRSSGADRALGWLLAVGGALGCLAALVLTIEKIELLKDPAYLPSCNLNPILSCGSIMSTSQAELFGFPNPLLGLAAFPIVIVTGVLAISGTPLRRWHWLGFQLGVTAGAILVGWLIFQSLYRIGALCPYCMIVWTVTIPICWYVTLRNARNGIFGQRIARSRTLSIVVEWHALVLVGMFLLVVTLITARFWDYWTTIL